MIKAPKRWSAAQPCSNRANNDCSHAFRRAVVPASISTWPVDSARSKASVVFSCSLITLPCNAWLRMSNASAAFLR